MNALPEIPLHIVTDVLDKLLPLELSEQNGNFQRLVVERVFQTGKQIDDLTVRELRELIETAAADFNAAPNPEPIQ